MSEDKVAATLVTLPKLHQAGKTYGVESMGDIVFGADPEFPLFDREGRPIPAARFYPAAHEGKIEVKSYNAAWTCGSLFRDGYAVELNPASYPCRQIVSRNMWHLFQDLRGKLGKSGGTFGEGASVKIDLPSFAKEAPPDCLAFGCSPSSNAYHPEDNGIPQIEAMTHPWRYMGKHFHFSDPRARYRLKPDDVGLGMPWSLPAEIPQAVKHLDLFCTIPLIMVGFEGVGGRLRRRFYGKAGEYRPGKTYVGLEYRTPGGPIWKRPEIASWLMGMARMVLRSHVEIKAAWDPSYEPLIEKAINTGNQDLAKQLVQETKYSPITTLPLLRELGDSAIHWANADQAWWIAKLPPGWGDYMWDRVRLNSNANDLIKGVHWPSMRQTLSVAA